MRSLSTIATIKIPAHPIYDIELPEEWVVPSGVLVRFGRKDKKSKALSPANRVAALNRKGSENLNCYACPSTGQMYGSSQHIKAVPVCGCGHKWVEHHYHNCRHCELVGCFPTI